MQSQGVQKKAVFAWSPGLHPENLLAVPRRPRSWGIYEAEELEERDLAALGLLGSPVGVSLETQARQRKTITG